MSVVTNASVMQADASPSSVTDTIVEATVKACRQAFGRRLGHIILTGSLARNEATLLAHSAGWRVLGDAEFLLVFSRGFPLPAQATVDALSKTISDRLGHETVLCPVHLSAVRRSYLLRLPRHIFSYELKTKGRVVYGDPEILQLVPQFSPEVIEREDAWRMLSNRTIELLEQLAKVPDGQEEPGLELFYSSVKLVLDAATSLLVFLGAYEPTYCARAERLKTLADDTSAIQSTAVPLSRFAVDVTAATRWKLSPDLAMTGRNGWSLCRAARDYASRLWAWELAQMTGLQPALPSLELVCQWGWDLGFSRRWRGWLHVARETGWWQSRRDWSRWSSLARRGSPRHWIYALAAECASREETFSPGQTPGAATGLALSELRPFLPVVQPPENGNQDDWRALVCDLAWNYHHFVERTRA